MTKEAKQALKERVIEELNDAINDIFYKWQEEQKIQYGDVDPYDVINMDYATEMLAGYMVDAMEKQDLYNR